MPGIFDANFLKTAAFIHAHCSPDGVVTVGAEDGPRSGWSSAGLLLASLGAADLRENLPLAPAACRALRNLGGSLKDGWLPAFPTGAGATDPTATFLQLAVETLNWELCDRSEFDTLATASVAALLGSQSTEGAWSFFPGEPFPAVFSTCAVVRCLSALSRSKVEDHSGQVAKALETAILWLRSTAGTMDCAEAAATLYSCADYLSPEERLVLRDRILTSYDPGSICPTRIERHFGHTVIRFAAPYAASALLGSEGLPRSIAIRLIRWFLESLETNLATLPGTHIVSWPTRDVLLGLGRARDTIHNSDVLALISAIEASELLAARSQSALRLAAELGPANDTTWRERMRRPCRILHISDLHLGEYQRDRRFPLMVCDLVRDVRAILQDPLDFVVVSGDLTSNTAEEHELHPVEFEEAHQFLQELLAEFGLGSERLVVVPGNHDVTWVPARIRMTQHAQRLNTVNYRNFSRALLGGEPSKNLFTSIFSEESSLIIAGLNTCGFEDREGNAWLGYVGDEQLQQLSQAVRLAESKIGREIVKVAVLHHHLVPVSHTEYAGPDFKPISLTLDAEAVMRHLLQLGFDLVLHGHQHQPFIGVEGRVLRTNMPGGTPRSMFRSLIIHGAGSLGAPTQNLGTIARNSYSLVETVDDGVRIVVRESHPEAPGEYTDYLRTTLPRA